MGLKNFWYDIVSGFDYTMWPYAENGFSEVMAASKDRPDLESRYKSALQGLIKIHQNYVEHLTEFLRISPGREDVLQADRIARMYISHHGPFELRFMADQADGFFGYYKNFTELTGSQKIRRSASIFIRDETTKLQDNLKKLENELNMLASA